jgi:hypothetical protein
MQCVIMQIVIMLSLCCLSFAECHYAKCHGTTKCSTMPCWNKDWTHLCSGPCWFRWQPRGHPACRWRHPLGRGQYNLGQKTDFYVIIIIHVWENTHKQGTLFHAIGFYLSNWQKVQFSTDLFWPNHRCLYTEKAWFKTKWKYAKALIKLKVVKWLN